MRVRDVAERLEVSVATVYAMVARGKLRCTRVGAGRGVIRISEDQLAEFLRANEPSEAQQPANRTSLKHLRLS
jgi:excisionase family DNA binding protein